MQQRGITKYYQPLQRETVIALLIKALTKASPSEKRFILSGVEEKLSIRWTHCTYG